MKISVVILNYLNWKDTIECIDSLLNQSHKNLEIIIVDNHSNNESVNKFIEKYAAIPHIHILESSENEGFARGNNIGITYSMDQLNIYNIFVANNDTIFTDENFFSKLVNEPIDPTIGVIGTRIIGSDGLNQNPFKARIDWKFLVNRYAVLKWNIVRRSMQESKSKLSRSLIKLYFKRKHKDSEDINDSSNATSGIPDGSPKDISMLHGSAIFFTENYLNIMRGFYPKTFLYNEERILYMVLKKAKLETAIREDLELYHKEDQSSALSFSNDSYKTKVFSYASTNEAIKAKTYSLKRIKEITNNFEYNFKKLK